VINPAREPPSWALGKVLAVPVADAWLADLRGALWFLAGPVLALARAPPGCPGPGPGRSPDRASGLGVGCHGGSRSPEGETRATGAPSAS